MMCMHQCDASFFTEAAASMKKTYLFLNFIFKKKLVHNLIHLRLSIEEKSIWVFLQ